MLQFLFLLHILFLPFGVDFLLFFSILLFLGPYHKNYQRTVIYTSEGNSYIHLPGLTVAQDAEGERRYLLPDGLGSIRQAVNETKTIVAVNQFDPYGNPIEGDGGDPYGFTGEWWIQDLGLLHLRARWYSPKEGIFLSKDTWGGDPEHPATLHGWNYVLNNPINLTDPSGLCSRVPQLGPSDCEKFANEVQQIIERAKVARPRAINDNNEHQAEFVVQALAAYYSGFKMTTDTEIFGRPLYIPNPIIMYDTVPERWPVPDDPEGKIWQVFRDPPVPEAEEMALSYGFKRIFYDNTHHYFANFYEAWFYGDTFARYHNGYREVNQVAEGAPYDHSAADILIVELAIDHTNQTQGFFGDQIDVLPNLLRREACANSLGEIYAGWGPNNSTVLEWLGPPPTP